ncbi:hypothetical protein, partial [Aquimarina agarivorans]|uniref:hypothetical protein n=1 Tax=Aquimarina agarivorans TaxID=980584 RepID=UPI000248ED13
MKKIQLLLLFLTPLFFANCDQFYCVEYTISNTSDKDINVRFSSQEFEIPQKQIVVKSNSNAVLHEYFASGQQTNTYLKNLNTLAFDNLTISTTDSISYNKNPININLWQKNKERKTDGCGNIVLKVTAN